MNKNGLPELVKNFTRLPEKRQAEVLGMLKALTFIQMGGTSDALDFISKIDKAQVEGQGERAAEGPFETLDGAETAAAKPRVPEKGGPAGIITA
ncbi:MAG: hypothetical protein LBI91_03920 [Spirochaetaceae bacterium]|nr:hypothetical protein [Spirochaetaceae bacterium]